MNGANSMSSEETPVAGSDSRAAAIERACELGLRSHFPGLEIVDRRLEIAAEGDSGRRIDLLAVDGTGRAILISFIDGASDEGLLAALDSVAFARQYREPLEQHLRSVRADVGGVRARAPLSILVAESFAPRVIERLALVPPRELALFEVIELKGAGHSTVSFRPVGSARSPVDAEQFLAALPPGERACAELLARRLPRIDERFLCTPSEDSLVWRAGDRDVCRLDRAADGLVAWDATSNEPIPLRAVADVASLLERVIRATRAPAEKPEPRAPVQLLTPEELAAFRDP